MFAILSWKEPLRNLDPLCRYDFEETETGILKRVGHPASQYYNLGYTKYDSLTIEK